MWISLRASHGGHAKIEHEQGHRYGEDAVAQGGEAFDTLPGNAVVQGWHRRESNGSGRHGQNQIQKAARNARGRGQVLGKTRCGWGQLRGTILLLLGMAAAAAAQDTPAPPPAPDPGSSQPAQSPPAEKKEGSSPAAQATKKVGMAALNKARDWETGWFAGVYVEKGRSMLPMTAAQRRSIYFEQTLGTPGAYLKRIFAAGIDQARGSPSQWQGGWGGYGERFASREGQFISANSLAALGNAALRYEPRYDQCQCSGFWPRTRHAIVRKFVTYDSSEMHRRPQLALFGGAFGGGMISTAWKPKPRDPLAEGGRAMLGQAGWGALLNFFIEFAGDINHKIGAKKKSTQKY